jgi:hypothetical protein
MLITCRYRTDAGSRLAPEGSSRCTAAEDGSLPVPTSLLGESHVGRCFRWLAEGLSVYIAATSEFLRATLRRQFTIEVTVKL